MLEVSALVVVVDFLEGRLLELSQAHVHIILIFSSSHSLIQLFILIIPLLSRIHLLGHSHTSYARSISVLLVLLLLLLLLILHGCVWLDLLLCVSIVSIMGVALLRITLALLIA